MGENFELESKTNVTLIEFDDQQKAKIAAALQALADQIVPPNSDSYGVVEGSDADMGSPYPKTTNEDTRIALIIDSTLRIKSEVGVETWISNQTHSSQALLETSNDLSTYITQTKEEPLLLKIAIESTAPDDKTLSYL